MSFSPQICITLGCSSICQLQESVTYSIFGDCEHRPCLVRLVPNNKVSWSILAPSQSVSPAWNKEYVQPNSFCSFEVWERLDIFNARVHTIPSADEIKYYDTAWLAICKSHKPVSAKTLVWCVELANVSWNFARVPLVIAS